jgi:NADH-quinone oxidoreductase subunit E
MSATIHSLPFEQPASFSFTEENKARAEKIIARYPAGRQQSAILPLLMIAQEQHDNWLPRAAIDYVTTYLDMPRIKGYEVATFYSMYNLKPVGKHYIEICTTTPCALRGSGELVEACAKHLGVGLNETTPDGQFTVVEVECLGACVNAPMLQIGEHYYEDLTAESMTQMLKDLQAGKPLNPGSQTRPYGSMNANGPTTLKTQAEAAGLKMQAV